MGKLHIWLKLGGLMNSNLRRDSLALLAGVAWLGVLIAYPASAGAATLQLGPGFWAGAADGFLALIKLLISPVVPVSIVDPAANWYYTAGYYLGVLIFAGSAGMAATVPTEPVQPRSLREERPALRLP
jgi:hypothetical protein